MEFILSLIPVLVVTGASEGIGRAYAFVVSDCLNTITLPTFVCMTLNFST